MAAQDSTEDHSPEQSPIQSAPQPPARLEAIIASAMDAIITVDEGQRIIGFNPAAEQMFGIQANEVIGEPIERFIPHRYRATHGTHIRRFTETGDTGRRMGALGAISALRANGEEFPVEASISQARAGGEHLSTVILRDITERKANEKSQALLAREVDHRAKNILAIVSSLVQLTKAPTPAAYMDSLSGRIAAMSRAHSLLAQQRWQGASLGRVVQDELEAHTTSAQFDCNGPDLILSSRSVQPVSMLFHELATNAVKYGALSVPEGHVQVSWTRVHGNSFELQWRERDGPEVTQPGQPGFGSTLIQQIIESQLGGSYETRWSPAGYELMLRLPETTLQLSHEALASLPMDEEPNLPPRPRARPNRTAIAAPDGNNLGGTLLIVEDEPLLAMQLSQSLQSYGWSILGVAGTIEDANRILSDKHRPDAAILDVDLGGSPVFPLARSLRRLQIPFVFCTGYEDLGYSREFSDCTAVRKPATVLQIVRALRDVVHNINGPSQMA